ncbi:hypothetical protein ACH95_02675 [Bacillus glycinifermentans]|uniref:UPF0354 protein AB447_213565 n=1 Tax=Bacillus glycinifermentans TaxID=1664069 RepID=A0A0J6EC89_9BACI|nr:DUF1444 domain-containing protein [Bacillus glycinifermentans]ATH92809.1 DUF1444 domain-containing protein [Bacillus glycinifermentans]KMM63175.1 hypothetical protein ACH95_02675 [Bacillus glycinifermentans]KRT94679.1 hypothetical protein AB447_213565 [Bacillus glycinifermentans]MEC0485642.1 DUF1444 domain-containing protein [Bacillus glycinifermentans]MEC0493588.1 DUF1444 domain-containing protein [Bacillus glycinifermentans]
MKMTSRKLSDILKKRLQNESWTFYFDREKDTLRIEDKATKKGITLELPGIIAKWEQKKGEAIDEVVYYTEEALKAMKGQAQEMEGRESLIYPVIRSTSFPEKSSAGIPLIFDDHTAETRIYYALDLGNTYRLIDEKMLEKEGWTKERIRETSSFNLRSLKTVVKEDVVADNRFYFFRANDGYDASRVLNESILAAYEQKAEGALAVSIPHQDVLIIADIRNQAGYDILGQMSMSFFASGTVPITALSFLYEDGKLEPVFILAQNRPKKK